MVRFMTVALVLLGGSTVQAQDGYLLIKASKDKDARVDKVNVTLCVIDAIKSVTDGDEVKEWRVTLTSAEKSEALGEFVVPATPFKYLTSREIRYSLNPSSMKKGDKYGVAFGTVESKGTEGNVVFKKTVTLMVHEHSVIFPPKK